MQHYEIVSRYYRRTNKIGDKLRIDIADGENIVGVEELVAKDGDDYTIIHTARQVERHGRKR